MKPIDLTESELAAINQFLGENWEAFKGTAASLLDDAEIEALDRKLSGDKT